MKGRYLDLIQARFDESRRLATLENVSYYERVRAKISRSGIEVSPGLRQPTGGDLERANDGRYHLQSRIRKCSILFWERHSYSGPLENVLARKC
jgi:hypothetical protein